MDKKSKILIITLILLIIISVYLTYKRAYIDKDFEIIYSEEESEALEEDSTELNIDNININKEFLE